MARDAAGNCTQHGIRSARPSPRKFTDLSPRAPPPTTGRSDTNLKESCPSGRRTPAFAANGHLALPCRNSLALRVKPELRQVCIHREARPEDRGPPRKELRGVSISVLGCFPEVEGRVPSSSSRHWPSRQSSAEASLRHLPPMAISLRRAGTPSLCE